MVDGKNSSTQLASLSSSRKKDLLEQRERERRQSFRMHLPTTSVRSIPNRSVYIECMCVKTNSARAWRVSRSHSRIREERKNAAHVYARFSFFIIFVSIEYAVEQWCIVRAIWSRRILPLCRSSSSSWKMNSAVKTSLGILCLLSLAFAVAEEKTQDKFDELCQVTRRKWQTWLVDGAEILLLGSTM